MTWVEDDTLGLFKTIPGPGEDFYLLAFLSSHKTNQALEFFEKLHFYIQAIMKHPMNTAKTVHRQVELEMSMQDLFTKGRFLPRKNFTDKSLLCADLEQTLCSLFGFCSVQDPLSLQKINRPRQNHSFSTASLSLGDHSNATSNYSWMNRTIEIAQEEREGIIGVGRMLATECRIGFKKVDVHFTKEREEVLDIIYQKVLGELAGPRELFNIGEKWSHRTGSGPAAIIASPKDKGDGTDFGQSKESLTSIRAQEEQTQEEEEFFKGMNEGGHTDFGFGQDDGNGGNQFEFNFEEQKKEGHDVMVFEMPIETERNFEFSFPESKSRSKQVLENKLPEQHSTIPFDRTETNSPNRSKRQSFSKQARNTYEVDQPSTPSSIFAEENRLPVHKSYEPVHIFPSRPPFEGSYLPSPETLNDHHLRERHFNPIHIYSQTSQSVESSPSIQPQSYRATNPFGNNTPQHSPPKSNEFDIIKITSPKDTAGEDSGNWEGWGKRPKTVDPSRLLQGRKDDEDNEFKGWGNMNMEESNVVIKTEDTIHQMVSNEDRLKRMPFTNSPYAQVNAGHEHQISQNTQASLSNPYAEHQRSIPHKSPITLPQNDVNFTNPKVAPTTIPSPQQVNQQEEIMFTRGYKQPVLDLTSDLTDTKQIRTRQLSGRLHTPLIEEQKQQFYQPEKLVTSYGYSATPRTKEELVVPPLPSIHEGKEQVFEPGQVHWRHHEQIFSPENSQTKSETFNFSQPQGRLPQSKEEVKLVYSQGSRFEYDQTVNTDPQQVQQQFTQHIPRNKSQGIDINILPENNTGHLDQNDSAFNFSKVQGQNTISIMPEEKDFFGDFDSTNFFNEKPQQTTYQTIQTFHSHPAAGQLHSPKPIEILHHPVYQTPVQETKKPPNMPYQVMRTSGTDNIDLLGLDITPVGSNINHPILGFQNPKSSNPFEEDSPGQSHVHSASLQTPNHHTDPIILPAMPIVPLVPIIQPSSPVSPSERVDSPPSLNNFQLLHIDKLLHRESLSTKTTITELIGRLSLSTMVTSASHAKVRVALVGDYWHREGLAKRVPPKDLEGIVEDLPCAVE